LPVVLYGCESWSLTLREECRLRFFENKVLRRIFGPQRAEVTGEWRRLHNKELYALARMGALVGKPEGRNHLEDPGVDGRIILKWIFERLDRGAWTGSV
jgi:hypothetical protein